jgi:hypothetical protein
MSSRTLAQQESYEKTYYISIIMKLFIAKNKGRTCAERKLCFVSCLNFNPSEHCIETRKNEMVAKNHVDSIEHNNNNIMIIMKIITHLTLFG